MPVPTKRDETVTRQALERWLVQALGADGVDVGALVMPESSGFSNETLVFDATISRGGRRDTKGLVARIRPTGYAVFPEYDMGLQYNAMDIVGKHSEVPVPPLIGYEPDDAWLGQPFYVMEKIEGQVPSDNPPYVVESWVKDASPEQQERLYRSSLEAMAGIARIDIEKADVAFLDRPHYGPPGIAQQVAYYEMAFDWALGDRSDPVIDATRKWLRDNLPDDPAPNGICWGDSRPGNIMYRDFRPVAIFDWEMAAIGPAEVDLGWWLMFCEYHPSSSGVPQLPGFLDRDATLAFYSELIGREIRDIDYYEFFAWARFAMVMIRLSDQFIESGTLPEEMAFAFDNPCTQALAARLGM